MSPTQPPPSYFLPRPQSPQTPTPHHPPPQPAKPPPNPRPPNHSTLPSPLTRKAYNTPALAHLLPYLTLGFTPQFTSGNSLLCALYALVGSLRSARNLHSPNGLPLPEKEHITLQHLLDIFHGRGRKSISARTGKILDRGGESITWFGVAKQAFAFREVEQDEEDEEGEEEITSVLEGEVLSDVRYHHTSRYGGKIYSGTSFRGERGTFLGGVVEFVQNPGLGMGYLKKVERYLEGLRREGMDAATIVEVRKGFLNTEELTDVQVWMVLMVANEEFGMGFGLGVVKSGFQGGWRKKKWVVEWEEEIRDANEEEVVFPWREECFEWDGEMLVETWVSVHPCLGQKEGSGPVVWIHNDGFEERGVVQCGLLQAVAHWESMGMDDGEYERGRKVVEAWGVDGLLCKKGECWRVVQDTVMGHGQLEVVVKGGSFVWWRAPREEMVDGDDGKRYLWMGTCGGGDDGWMCEEFLEEVERWVDGNVVVVEEKEKDNGVAETPLAVSENNNINDTSDKIASKETTPLPSTPQPKEEIEAMTELGTKRKAEDEDEEREVKRGRSEEGETEK